MPKKRIFDESGGVVSVIETDDQAKTTTIGRYQNVDPIIEHNKKLQTENDGFNKARDLRRVASIPLVILEKWCKEDGVPLRKFLRKPRNYQKWLRRKIYDPDNSMFLTAPHARPRKAKA